MTAGGFEVEPGALAGHRSRVSAIAAEIQQAAAAGQATTPVGSDAFGIIGQPFALMVQDTVSTAVQNLQAVAETADQLADDSIKVGKGIATELTEQPGEQQGQSSSETRASRGPSVDDQTEIYTQESSRVSLDSLTSYNTAESHDSDSIDSSSQSP